VTSRADAPRAAKHASVRPHNGRSGFRFASLGTLSALLAFGQAACASPSASPGAPTSLSSLESAPGPLDALTRRYARLRQRLTERGMPESSGPARWFVLEGEGTSAPLDLPTDRCSTFVALGSGGLRDLRLALYDGEGREVALDAISGEGALVHVCPDGTASSHAPHHLVATSESGAGALLVGGFTLAPGARPNFDGLFDGLLTPPVPRVIVESRLAQAREPLLARGLAVRGEASFHVLGEGSSARRTESLSSDRCYTIAVASTDALTDVDLFVYDAQGAEIARDLGHDAVPALQVCPIEAGPHTFEARAFAGAGGLGLQVFEEPARVSPNDASPRLAEEGGDSRAVQEGDDEFAPTAVLEPVFASLTARGYGRAVPLEERGVIAPGEERAHVFAAPAGCIVVLAAGTGRGADLDLALTDVRGGLLAEDTSVQTVARAGFCQASPAEMRAALKAFGRAGRYAIAMVPAPRAIRTARALRLDEARATLVDRGYRSTATREQSLVEGQRHLVEFPVRAGTCAALAVAGDPGLTDVDLFLHDATSKLLVRDSGPAPFASVSRCAETDEALRVEVLAYRGSGSVAIERLEARP
jgi:hypothetical protein